MTGGIAVAVVGCGAVVQRLHAAALAGLEQAGDVRVVGVADPDERQARDVASRFVAARHFSSLPDLLAVASPEIVLVASPAGLHREHIGLALGRGCNILCEKPLAPTAAAAIAISGDATAVGRIVAVGMTRRYNPALALAAAIVASGELGDELTFQCREGSLFGWPLATDAGFRRQAGGGGVLMDKGVHALDSLRWLFGPLSVEGSWDDAQQGGVEETTRLALRAEQARGEVLLSWDHDCLNGLWIQGARTELFVDPSEHRFVELRESGGAWTRRETSAAWPSSTTAHDSATERPAGYDDCIRLQWIGMVRAVRFGETPPVGPDLAAEVTGLIERAYAESRPLDEPWRPSVERKAAGMRHWRAETIA